jgi:biotin carboxyl carrier protein
MIHRFAVTRGKESQAVSVEPLEGGLYRVTVDGRERIIDAARVNGDSWSIADAGGGRQRIVDLDTAANGDLLASVQNATIALKLVDARRAAAAKLAAPREPSGPQPIRAPMPGKVVKVLVKAGEAVKSGQGVAVVEAMKMENELRAPRDGTIAEVAAKDGQAVEAGQVLVTLT